MALLVLLDDRERRPSPVGIHRRVTWSRKTYTSERRAAPKCCRSASTRWVMAEAPERTGYYFNRDLPYFALIAKGISLPSGRWIRIADDEQPPWKVQELLAGIVHVLPSQVPFVALLTDFDVQEFEQELRGHSPDAQQKRLVH